MQSGYRRVSPTAAPIEPTTIYSKRRGEMKRCSAAVSALLCQQSKRGSHFPSVEIRNEVIEREP